jgi:hypothetical protein
LRFIQTTDYKVNCPYCRTVLNTEIEEVEREEEEEEDDVEDEDYDEEEEELGHFNVINEYDFPIESFVAAFEEKGYGLLDALSIVLPSFMKSHPKFTKEYLDTMDKCFSEIEIDVMNEKYEREQMLLEDTQPNLSV